MITRLRLENFKSFRNAELNLGPFTVLIGANASGKSNVRDAFRFLHGVGRGYSLPDIIGEKRGEGGERVWTGIRGATREITFQGAERFVLECSFPGQPYFPDHGVVQETYRIEVETGQPGEVPRVIEESLALDSEREYIYRAELQENKSKPYSGTLELQVFNGKKQEQPLTLPDYQPVIASLEKRLVDNDDWTPEVHMSLVDALAALGSIQFIELDILALRTPSLPGQDDLGDQGENLSSVLLAICRDSKKKRALLTWIQALTPTDAIDLEFPADFEGKVLVHLVERGGQRVSAHSASDGTLRFLGILAALMQPHPVATLFFDEIDTGIHPARLHLLVQLIDQVSGERRTQVIATTHSSTLLQLLSPQMLENVSLTYRLEGHEETSIKRILDIPDARRLIQEQDILDLHNSGWFEDAVTFTQEEGEAA